MKRCYYTKSMMDNDPIKNGKLHILSTNQIKTLCGLELNGRWMIVGEHEDATCIKCIENTLEKPADTD